VFASICKHFDGKRQGIPLYIEGQTRNTRNQEDFLELRVDGPQFTELSHNEWKIYIEVNILVQSVMDDKNYHRIHQNVGIVAAAFSDIEVFKYGKLPGDNQELWTCIQLVQNERSRQQINIFHFGQVDKQTRLMQAAVEGHYQTFLKGE